MVPELRKRFNATFTPDKYRGFLSLLDAGCGTTVKFRNCETPCFLPRALFQKMERYGVELICRLMTPDYLARSLSDGPGAKEALQRNLHPGQVPAIFEPARRGLRDHGQISQLRNTLLPAARAVPEDGALRCRADLPIDDA